MGKFDTLFKLNKMAIDFSGLIISTLRYPKLAKYKKILNRNTELKNKRSTDKCYICGLGPSLKTVDLEKLDGDTIVVNRFYLYDNEKKMNPTYYCITDSNFLHQENINVLFDAVNSYKDTTYFLNAAFYEILSKKYPDKDNLYYSCNWKGTFRHNSKIDFTKNMSAMGNVIGYAIYLALYLGYKEIILLGCDFNSFASQKPIHCYEDKEDERKISLSFELFCYSFVADTHYELAKYATQNHIRIINATPGSLIDAYDRDENYILKYTNDTNNYKKD